MPGSLTPPSAARALTRAILRTIRHFLLLLLLPAAISCQKEFRIGDYTLEKLSVTPGVLLQDATIIAPSLSVLVSGPEDERWDVTVTGEKPGETMAFDCRTGVAAALQLTALGLGPSRKEASVSIKVTRKGTGETLAVRGGIRVALIVETLGPEGEPKKRQTVHIRQLAVLAADGEHPVDIASDGTAALALNEGDTGELVILYTLDERDPGPVSCTVTQDGQAPLLLKERTLLCDQKGRITVTFEAASPGEGAAVITLCGSETPTPLTLLFTVGERPLKATLTPNRFVFAENRTAHGTVTTEGYRQGEQRRVVLRYREWPGGREGRAEYRSVPVTEPLRVVLWKAGEAAAWESVTFRAEVYAGEAASPEAVSQEVTVRPLRPLYHWGDENGLAVMDDEPVRSRTENAPVSMTFDLREDLHEYIRKITLKDTRTGKETVSYAPLAHNPAYYQLEMTRPSRGKHTFYLTADTDEGAFAFQLTKEFVDVWTATPFIDGSSLYASLTGPEQSLQAECRMGICASVYAHFDYTVAEEHDGRPVNVEREWWAYQETRRIDYTLAAGTGRTTVTIQSGWVNTAIRQLVDLGAGKAWPAQTEASRWVKDRYGKYKKEYYTPENSRTGVHMYIKYNEEFRSAGYDIELDISRLAPVLQQNGIAYF